MRAKVNIRTICKDSNNIWHKLRWSSTGGEVTCTCGCNKIYHLKDGRYKCKSCGKIFSDRSGTLLQNSRLSTTIWLIAIFKFASCKECSAIDLQKECGVNYKSALLMLHKLRYLSGLDKVLLEGAIRVDEAYIGGWSDMHFNKKIEFMKKSGFMGISDKRYDKHKLLRASSAKKFHILSLTDDNNKTQIYHCPNPISKEAVKYILKGTLASAIISDESKLYVGQGLPVYQSNHSKHIFMSPEGYSSNTCENKFSWVKRKWNGVYSHTSEKYLQLYLWQRQWHYNHNKGVDDSFIALCSLAISNKVRISDIKNYNYKSKFPKSRREKEEEQAKNILASVGIISSVTDNYGRVYK